MITFEYGAMSSKYSCEAENKLTAYVTMCVHYGNSACLVMIYSPEECKSDNWISLNGQISKKLDEIFGGENAFDKYVESHVEEIRTCYKTIKQLV
jgi:hypothetical protein